MSFTSEKPMYNSKVSEFMRNGSGEEHERVFKKVIDQSIKDQQKIIAQGEIIEQAERLAAIKRG